ncbi:hypothetical protein F4778DRAFT_26287 [Xylariomycetidae sp. FL2044]|nr:hypothetical protein F4778DRAFT_26287 [Xylariomycetidae sp. FL2044]
MESRAETNTIRLCTLCRKPIATESAYKRHISYCRRSQERHKKRKQACAACHVAKARCSFEAECARCRSKGVPCVYGDAAAAIAVQSPVSPDSAALVLSSSESRKGEGGGDGSPGVIGSGPGPEPEPEPTSSATSSESGSSSSNSLISVPHAATAATTISTTTSITYRNPFASITSQVAAATYWRGDRFFDGVLTASSPRPVSQLRADPAAQHGASFILEAVCALPRMMTRRATLPWFVHGHWYAEALPEALRTCAGLAERYLDPRRDRDKVPFWSMVDGENRRLLRVMNSIGTQETLAGMQAQILYIAMCALETMTTKRFLEVRLQMLMTFELYCKRVCMLDGYAPFRVDEIANPDLTWEDWVYAENRRRCAGFWFIISRVIDLKYGAACTAITGFRRLPLPCPASLWEARTRQDWEAAREGFCRNPRPSLRTIGDLVEARAEPYDFETRQKLDDWHASCDKLGLLVTMATTMV